MKLEIEKEMEDYRATASKKENLLQEEIKIWQVIVIKLLLTNTFLKRVITYRN